MALIIPILLAAHATASSPIETVDLWSLARPEAVCAASGSWVIGTNTQQPSVTNTNIELVVIEGRRVIQVMHRSTDPSDASHDLYQLDQGTLSPLLTEHTGPTPPVRFTFEREGETLVARASAGEEKTAFTTPPAADGPGLEVIVQAVPWRPGLVLRSPMLNRWSQKGQARAQSVTWTVEAVETIDTLAGSVETYRVVLKPDDLTWDMTLFISTERPHAIARIAYQPAGRPRALLSDLREIAFHCGSASTPR